MIAQDASGAKYSIKVGATFVGSSQLAQNLREAIKNLEKTATITTKVKVNYNVKEIKDGQEIIKKVTEDATKTLIKYKDNLGQIVERQKIVTESGKVFSDTVSKTSSTIEKANQQFGQLTTSTETSISSTGRLITRVKEYKDGVLQAVNVTQKWTEADGSLVTQTQKLDANGNKLADTIKNIVKDTTKAQQQFSNIHRTTETNVSSTGRLTTTVREYKDNVLQAVNITQQWRNAQGQLETQIQKLDANGHKLADTIRTTEADTATLTTTTNNYIDTQGREVTEITKLNSAGNGYIEIITKEINAQGLLTKTTEQMQVSRGNAVNNTRRLISSENELANTEKTLTTTISKVTDAQGREITTTKKLDASLNGTVEIITKEKNAQGQLITTTERMNVVNNQNVTATRRVTTVIEEETTARKTATQILKEQIGHTNNFIDTMGKIIKFQIITKIVTGFTTACRNAVMVVKEFDSALTEFKKVSDLSGEALDDYTKKLGELGTAVARTRTQMVEASTQFKKSGFSDEDSANLAQISSLYQNIADSEMSAGDSATFIISQMKAFKGEFKEFGTEAEKATHIIDSINEV